MLILSIETSCDETAVAVVRDGRDVLSNVVASQIATHAETGGVVPEVAAREHIKAMMPVLRSALKEACVTKNQIDAIAYTREPGLIGSLIVGRVTAEALAFAWDKPLIPVNHIHGHIYANWLEVEPAPKFPVLTLTVSGGHNELIFLKNHGDFELLGETLDDAAGEAFDKVARLLGLGYPGGPAIEKRAELGNPLAFAFPVALPGEMNFSFSGLKTSVLYHLKANQDRLNDVVFMNDTAASFQEAATKALCDKLMMAVKLKQPKEVHLAGGVSANKALRARISESLEILKNPPIFRFPARMSYCTDNAAMIGAAGFCLRH